MLLQNETNVRKRNHILDNHLKIDRRENQTESVVANFRELTFRA